GRAGLLARLPVQRRRNDGDQPQEPDDGPKTTNLGHLRDPFCCKTTEQPCIKSARRGNPLTILIQTKKTLPADFPKILLSDVVEGNNPQRKSANPLPCACSLQANLTAATPICYTQNAEVLATCAAIGMFLDARN